MVIYLVDWLLIGGGWDSACSFGSRVSSKGFVKQKTHKSYIKQGKSHRKHQKSPKKERKKGRKERKERKNERKKENDTYMVHTNKNKLSACRICKSLRPKELRRKEPKKRGRVQWGVVQKDGSSDGFCSLSFFKGFSMVF